MRTPLPLEKGATLPILFAFIKRAVGRHVIERLRRIRKIEQRHVRIVTKTDNEESLANNEIDENTFSSIQASSPVPTDLLLEKMLRSLAERIEQEGDPKVKKKYHRQEIVFFVFLHRRESTVSDVEAIQEIAERFGKDQRTIYRDIEELKEYLRA